MPHRLSILILIMTFAGCTGIGEVSTLGRYDFSYRIEGEPSARPLQIFDDGQKTFFQFRDVEPGIFTVSAEKQLALMSSRRDGQYLVIDRIDREFVFQVGQEKVRARAEYIGKQNRTVLPHDIAPIRDVPSATSSLSGFESYRIRFPNDSIEIVEGGRLSLERLLPKALVAKRITILASSARERRDRGIGLMRAAAIRKWLVEQGVVRARIRVVNPTMAIATPEYCEVQLSSLQTLGKSTAVLKRIAWQPRPTLYGAARPRKVSMPAKSIFQSGRVGMVDEGIIVK